MRRLAARCWRPVSCLPNGTGLRLLVCMVWSENLLEVVAMTKWQGLGTVEVLTGRMLLLDPLASDADVNSDLNDLCNTAIRGWPAMMTYQA